MSSFDSTLNNRYRLERKIGEGGFAKVYLATDLELERQVAVKVLDQNWVNDQEFLGRFRKEAQAIARLDHPNILLIHDFGVANGVPFLVMPYVGGGTFATRMRQNRLTLDEIGFYLEQLGDALDYAHKQGIVHRDIKPTNILLRNDGRMVLTDFGLAKLIANASVEERTGVLGTVAYMAPEQFQGFVSASTDIYALGVLLYQVIAGKLPYEGNTREILVGHIRLAPKPLVGNPAMQQVDPKVVQALDQVIAKVLAKRPAERYPSCQALTFAYRQAIKAGQRSAKKYQPETDDESTEREIGAGAVGLPVPRQTPPPGVYIKNPDNSPPAGQVSPAFPQKVEAPAGQRPPLVVPAPPAGNLDLEATQVAPPKESPRPVVVPPPPKPAPPPVRKQVMLKPPRISVLTEPDQGFRATFELTGETMTLGREPDNNLCLPLAIISRHHALLQRLNTGLQGPHYKIIDRKSVNHLYFKGREVPEKVLENGDVIEIGVRGYGQYIVQLTYHAPVFGFE